MEPSHWRDQSFPQQMQEEKITSATPPFRPLEKPLFGSAPGPLSDQRE